MKDDNQERKTSLSAMASKEEGSVINADDLKLAEMGYKPVSPAWERLLMSRNSRGGSP